VGSNPTAAFFFRRCSLFCSRLSLCPHPLKGLRVFVDELVNEFDVGPVRPCSLGADRAAQELGRKAGILIIWAMTVLIGAWVVGMAFILAVLTIRELRAWLGVS
jgi:hypothetical protein